MFLLPSPGKLEDRFTRRYGSFRVVQGGEPRSCQHIAQCDVQRRCMNPGCALNRATAAPNRDTRPPLAAPDPFVVLAYPLLHRWLIAWRDNSQNNREASTTHRSRAPAVQPVGCQPRRWKTSPSATPRTGRASLPSAWATRLWAPSPSSRARRSAAPSRFPTASRMPSGRSRRFRC